MSKKQERLAATIAAAYAGGGSGDDTDTEYTPWWQVYKAQKDEQPDDVMSLDSVDSLIFVTASEAKYVQPPPSLPVPDTPPSAATPASDAPTRLPSVVLAPASSCKKSRCGNNVHGNNVGNGGGYHVPDGTHEGKCAIPCSRSQHCGSHR